MGTVLVTGAGNGIGKAVCDLLVAHGHDVTGIDIDEKGLGQLPPEVETYWMDVNDRERVPALVQRLDADVVINNAGYQALGSVEDMPVNEVENHFATNVFGLWNVTRSVLPQIRENNGRIINVSSLAAEVTAPFWGAYTASKKAVNGVTAALRMELADTDADAILVEPGPIRTGFNERGREKLRQYLPKSWYADKYQRYLDKGLGGVSPERAARIIVHAAETRFPQYKYTVTWEAFLAPKLEALLPQKLWEWLIRKTQGG